MPDWLRPLVTFLPEPPARMRVALGRALFPLRSPKFERREANQFAWIPIQDIVGPRSNAVLVMNLKPRKPRDPQRSPQENPIESDKWSGSRLGEAHVAYLDFAAEVERRKEGGEPMFSVYCIYLRELSGNVLSRHTLAIESDDEAIKVGAVLCYACADLSAGFEVWKGEFLLMVGGIAPAPTREELSRRSQQIVIDREIALRDSRQALAESKHLLKTIDEWTANSEPSRAVRRA